MRLILILISILLIENQRVHGCNRGRGGGGSSGTTVAYDDGLCVGGIGGCVDAGCNLLGLKINLF
jgi:hypothetical protein